MAGSAKYKKKIIQWVTLIKANTAVAQQHQSPLQLSPSYAFLHLKRTVLWCWAGNQNYIVPPLACRGHCVSIRGHCCLCFRSVNDEKSNYLLKVQQPGRGEKVAALTVIKFSLHFSAIASKGFFLSIGRKHTLCCQLRVFSGRGCQSLL